MRRLSALVTVLLIICISGIAYYFVSDSCSNPLFKQGSDSMHLDCSVIQVPGHSDVLIEIRYAKTLVFGETWYGQSEETFRGDISRWYVNIIGRSVRITGQENGAYYVIPFQVDDNSGAEGHLTYLGLFKWDGAGAMELKDDFLLGNFVSIQSLEYKDGLITAQFRGTLSPELAKFISISSFKHKPAPYHQNVTRSVQMVGNKLVVQ